MLTTVDLKSIRQIVREEVESEVGSIKDDLGHDVRISQLIIQKNIDGLKNHIKDLEIRVTRMNNEDIDEEDDI